MASAFSTLMFGLIGLILSQGLAKGQPLLDRNHQENINGFLVKWHRNHKANDSGDILEIYEKKPKLKLVYTYLGHTYHTTYIDSVTAWSASTGKRTGLKGIMLTTVYTSGSELDVVILAKVHGAFHQVFKGVCSDALVVGHKRMPLQMIDLDGNSQPLIVFISTYQDRKGANLGSNGAQVWKWSNRSNRYVQVRHSVYAKQLARLNFTQ